MKTKEEFCPKCGNFTEGRADTKRCHICGTVLIINQPYLVPMFKKATNTVEEVEPSKVDELLATGEYSLIPISEEGFNVKINGEWNGIEIGKKIQEKNEKLKKMVAGYDNEQRNVRNDTMKQLIKKQKEK